MAGECDLGVDGVKGGDPLLVVRAVLAIVTGCCWAGWSLGGARMGPGGTAAGAWG